MRDAKEIGRDVRRLRRAKDMSQRELAKSVGVESMSISRYERGVAIPSDRVKERLANMLDTKVGVLFFGE